MDCADDRGVYPQNMEVYQQTGADFINKKWRFSNGNIMGIDGNKKFFSPLKHVGYFGIERNSDRKPLAKVIVFFFERILRIYRLVGGFKHEFIFHFIYGMSSFPLTNSYFSRWLLHH
jgi:hypothetical protein